METRTESARWGILMHRGGWEAESQHHRGGTEGKRQGPEGKGGSTGRNK